MTKSTIEGDSPIGVGSLASKPHYLPPGAFYALDRACAVVNESIDGFGCFLVGSCLMRRDYRDVDVRFIMSDEEYNRIFHLPDGSLRVNFWSFMCVTVGAWLSQQAGVSVDFQIQPQTQANSKHDGKRNALGVFVRYPGEYPTAALSPPPGDATVKP